MSIITWHNLYIVAGTLAAAALFSILSKSFRKFGRSQPDSVNSWRDYIKGQFLFLLSFLLSGGAMATVFFYLGPTQSRATDGGQLIDYKVMDLKENLIYEEADVEKYSYVSVLAKTIAPENGSATVAIYGDSQGGSKPEIGRINSVSNSWSRWDQKNSNKHLSIVIGGPTTQAAVPATQVHVLVYLTPK